MLTLREALSKCSTSSVIGSRDHPIRSSRKCARTGTPLMPRGERSIGYILKHPIFFLTSEQHGISGPRWREDTVLLLSVRACGRPTLGLLTEILPVIFEDRLAGVRDSISLYVDEHSLADHRALQDVADRR